MIPAPIRFFRGLFDAVCGPLLPRSTYLRLRIRVRSFANRRDEMLLLKRLLREGMVFVDIGANVGEYAVRASSLVGRADRSTPSSLFRRLSSCSRSMPVTEATSAYTTSP